MILSDQGIKDALKSGAIVIDPPPEDDHYDPSSVDLLLGDDFQMWDRGRLGQKGVDITLNMAEQQFTDTVKNYLVDAPIQDGCLTIPPYSKHPWHFLCQTRSRVVLKREHKIAARVEGKSSLARLGLLVHLTAPTIHTTFRGRIELAKKAAMVRWNAGRSAALNASENNNLPLIMPRNSATHGNQRFLDLGIAKQIEIDGVGMGVLSDGTAFLTGRGLARLCGVAHSLIHRLSSEWMEEPSKVRVETMKGLRRERGLDTLL